MRIGGISSLAGAVVATALLLPAVASADTVDYASNDVQAASIAATTTESSNESGGPEDNITVEPNVTVESTELFPSAGNITFTAADSVVTKAGSVVKADYGDLTITGGSGDTDNDAGISLSGSISAPAGSVTISVAGNVCFNSITAATTVEIIALGGSITACSGQATVKAQTLELLATDGIGSGGALKTTVSNLGAATGTGSINIDNTGDLSVDELSGLQVTGASGFINLTNSGSLNVDTNGETIDAPSGVNITTTGAGSNITTGGQASGGAIVTAASAYLQSGGDITLGDASGYGSVITGAGAILDAGGNLEMNANAVINNTPSGNVDVQANGNITMSTAVGSLSNAPAITTSGGGTVTVTTGAGGAFMAASTGANAVSAQNATVFIEADSATIGAGISSGNARTDITVASGNHPIALGSKPSGSLGLTQTEVHKITAGVLQIGSPAAGNLTITNPITSTGADFNVLTLITGGSVVNGAATQAPILTVPDLRFDAGHGIGTTGAIGTAVDALAGGNGAGPVALSNELPTTIGTVDGDTGITNNGTTTTLVSSGALSVSQQVKSTGALILQAADTGSPGADLTVAANAALTASDGGASLLAGDNVTVNSGATVSAGGAVNLECDYGDADPTDSCSIHVDQGGLTGSPVALRGGDDNGASFDVVGEALSGHGPLTITGARGTSSTASVTGTTVTDSPGAGLGLGNLTGAAITGDTFTGNATDGIAVDGSNGVLISGDTIWGNHGLGIDLLHGSNHGIAAPVLTSAAAKGGSTEVKGTLSGTAGHTFRLAFFDNATCDATGFTEGKRTIGTGDVTTNASGQGSFDVIVPAAIAPGDAIGATATDLSTNESSEFSRCIPPAIHSLKISPKRFKAAASGASTAQKGPGATVSYTDSLPAGSRFVVDHVLPGRTSGAKCAAPSPRNKHHRSCRRFVRLKGSFTHADAIGPNSFRFTGRLNRRKLPPGAYRLDVTPTIAGQAGQTVNALFSIK
jgi:hypothetical protein